MELPNIKPERKLSIIHISTLEKDGGAARVAWRLSQAQRKAGHRSFMIVGEKTSDSEYTYLIPKEIDINIQSLCQHQGWLYYDIVGSHRLIDNPLIQSCDIIHLHNLHGTYFNPWSLAILARHKPVVWTLHDMQSITGHCAHSFDCAKWQNGCGDCPYLPVYPAIPIDSTAFLWQHKKSIYDHSPFQIVAPSSWLKSKTEKSILKNHPSELIPNGVNCGVFKPYDKMAMRKKFNLPNDAILIGGVANGGAIRNGWKGGNFTVNAVQALWKQVPNCYYISVGAGGETGNKRVINIPNIKDENELARLYSALDIYLMTSIAENCPLVILEALACGVPVVAFATGGVPELVQDGQDGIIVGYQDTRALIQALVGIARNPELRKRFSANARRRAETVYDHDLISRKYEIIYSRYAHQWNDDIINTGIFPLAQIPNIIRTRPFMNAIKAYEGKTLVNRPQLSLNQHILA